MTVVNVMRFNSTSGGMVADTQVTSGMQKQNVVEKIMSIGNDDLIALVSGAGRMPNVFETFDALKENYEGAIKLLGHIEEEELPEDIAKRLSSVRGIADIISTITITQKRERIRRIFKSRYDINIDEFPTAEGINSSLWQDMKDIYTGENADDLAIEAQFIIIGKDTAGVHTYGVDSADIPVFIPNMYQSIGAGSDVADYVLGRFVESLPRKEWNNISLVKGMAALLRATNESTDSTLGVGGTPSVAYFEGDGGVIMLGEQEAHLASEIVRVGDSRLIPQKAMHTSLDALLRGKASFDDVERMVFKNNYHSISRFLRGYKALS